MSNQTKKVFVYVGHSNWGKSLTLQQITDGVAKKQQATIKDQHFWVKKMSNDDDAESLKKFAKYIYPSKWQTHAIIAYCPNHEKDNEAREILDTLAGYAELYFFVQETKFNRPQSQITTAEIAHLHTIGIVEVLTGHHKATVRAERFLQFIESHI